MITGKSRVIRKDINLSRILRNIDDMDHVKSKVGFPKEAPVASGEQSQMSEIATIAVYNEFGTKRIPARPFMQTAYRLNIRQRIPERLKIEARKVVLGKQDAMRGIGRVGAFLASETKKVVRAWAAPANKPSTMRAKKGVNNPLIDTGQMVNSITHVEVR